MEPQQREVWVISAVRTAIGSFGGFLKDTPVAKLATTVVQEAIRRSHIEATAVEACILGHVVHTELLDMYLSRFAAISAGMSKTSTAFSVNRLCGSGLQAIALAANSIWMGEAECVVAGGAESMSCGGYLATTARWGKRLGHSSLFDLVLGALSDPFHNVHMGITAENVAKKYGITREQQDLFSLESHVRAARAQSAGYFTDQLIPIVIKRKTATTTFETDEHVRPTITLADLTKLKPAFDENGTVTAGNASGLNDGAAALVLVSSSFGQRHHLQPLARIVGFGHCGVEPMEMGMGPVAAVQIALKKTGLTLQDMHVIESNEAFAAQALAVAHVLGIDPMITNPNGGAVALGHPIGATGGIIAIKAIYELLRIKKQYAIATMCIGGGQGIAAIFERCT